ncbi:MAG: hypothetical protein A3G83_08835 [Betaproteobacteria bacterium RIFCSPLOWO2_12_FULL_68_20]|nr:MAG: hypothetical protein A3G83_08835 [Betaproteobacteria bacterium RIFCSPLOWO2_12_FULL_68_20]
MQMLRTMIAAACAMSAAAFLAHVPEAGAQAGGSSAGSAPVYTPPQRGAPSRRVGGSSRGAGDALPAVMILAPDHVGLTTSESPSLYWYLSKPTTVRVEVTLVDEKGETPLIEYAIEKADGPAVHRVDLAKHNIKLKPNVDYQWSISVVPNPSERSNDVMAGGVVKRVAVPDAVRRAPGASKGELARLSASQGLWYDAIALYSELIEQSPKSAELRRQRAALLQQVGLKEIAEFDLRASR